MELRFLHFYPDLMNLYGSYANVSVLRRYLERLGHTVVVEAILPGKEADLTGADFLYMGAGTERAQKAALADFACYGTAVRAAAEDGTAMLFAGTAMELLGRTVSDAEGTVYEGIALADFTTVQGKKRLVEDVYGTTDLYPEAVVGFMNKCGVTTGITTPLLTTVSLGYGNEGEGTPEGFHWKNVFASELTGPLLVKNPRMLETAAAAILARRREALPEERPVDTWAEAGYAITAEQLRLRCKRP